MISTFLVAVLIASAVGQQVGTLTAETHPPLTYQHCTKSGCTSSSGSVTMDSNWRWTHATTGATNCYTGNTWDATLCPDPVTCSQKCAIDGADYPGTYGVKSDGTTVTLGFVTHGPYSTNIGSRLYLLASQSQYQIFKLKNQEFSFDVDVSQLPCGLNGALYFVEMDADGGMAKYPNNKAGAAYGTGYCDAQCPHDIKFINGEANILNWQPDSNNPNAGVGMYGSCCTEMDVWESNSMASAYTPHVCSVSGQYRCSGTQCGDGSNRYGGVCDKDGCDFNSYRMGNQGFLGVGKTVDTSKPFTVVTQWITVDNTTTGALSEIRRLYVQNGKVIMNSATNFTGLKPYTSVSDQFCNDQKTLFGDKNMFESLGGLKSMGTALNNGVVLVLSLWDDYTAQMLWLDSLYPINGTATKPGIARGACATTSGVPSVVEAQYPNAYVKYGNIKYGDIGSTYAH
jgi:cellulose 1,4-beta-cellobiosidase